MDPNDIVVPAELRPSDGRFGSGPSKVRPEAVAALRECAGGYLGTSHRRGPARAMVGRLREGLHHLFGLPADYEVVLGNGGSTVLWDGLAFCAIRARSRHAAFGEFSHKFARAVTLASHLELPEIDESEPGTHPTLSASERVDTYALTHNETSTGVAMPVVRPDTSGLVAVDATSAAGGLHVDPRDFDIYYFSPQKSFASDGGLWIALCSPSALERIARVASDRSYVPPSLDLRVAVESSRKDQTYNTPALATIFLMVEQIDWMLDNGGLGWATGRCARSADVLYSWAEAHRSASPFVKDPAQRSNVVATIDLDGSVDAGAVRAALRANGIVDIEPYRRLSRNQLRIATYPAIEPADVELLTRAVDYVIEALS